MKLKFSVGWRNHFPWHYWPGIVTDLFISTWLCMVTIGFATCRIHYILVCNKFTTYYFLETTENIPLIALEKKSLNIVLVLLSLPLQGCKSWCRQCNLNNIAFFFTFFKSYIDVHVISYGSPREWISNFTRIVKTQVKFWKIRVIL